MDHFGKLSNDEVVDICFRLEVKDMMRLKCVSKRWYRMISDLCIPRISKRLSICGIHFRSAAVSLMVYNENANKYVQMNPCLPKHIKKRFYDELETCFDRQVMQYVSTKEEGEDCVVEEVHGGAEEFVDSRYGLLLFSKERCCGGLEYRICNPTTNQCVTIPPPPPPPQKERKKSFVHAALAFDPTVSPHYKVVCVNVAAEEEIVIVDIFSSESGGMWQQHEIELVDIPVDYFVFKRNSVFYKGVVYMMSLSWKVISLDINSLDLRVIPLPIPERSIWGKLGHKGCLGLSEGYYRGCLGLATEEEEEEGGVYYTWLESRYIRLWLLEEDRSSSEGGGGLFWRLKHTVDCCLLRSRIFLMDVTKEIPIWSLPCGVHPNSDAIFLGTPQHIFLYNFITDEFRLLHQASEGQVFPFCFYSLFTYSRCLVPLNHFSNQQWKLPASIQW